MTLDEIRADIIGACREFQAAGKKIGYGSYLPTDEADGCALAAVYWQRGGNPSVAYDEGGNVLVYFVQARYGWSSDMRRSFVRGYDGIPQQWNDNVDVFDLGRAVRAEVLP